MTRREIEPLIELALAVFGSAVLGFLVGRALFGGWWPL